MVSPRFLTLATLIVSVSLATAAVGGEGRSVLEGPKLHLKSRTFSPAAGVEPALAGELAAPGAGPVHFLLQLPGPATPQEIETLRDQGVELLLPLKVNGWFASARRGAVLDAAIIRYAGRFHPTDKIEPRLLRDDLPPRILGPAGTIAVQVMFHLDVPRATAEAALAAHSGSFERFGRGLYRGQVPREQLLVLAGRDPVMWIEPGNPVNAPLNDLARVATKAEDVQNAVLAGSTISYDLSGAGVQVGVFDTGVDPGHDDFLTRLIRFSGTGDHGTHVGGIVGASGLLSDVTGGGAPFQYRGMAPECEIASYDISLDQSEYEEAILTYGVDLTNNSWVLSETCDYDILAKQADDLVNGGAGRAITICFGTGNNGGPPQYGVLTGYYSAFTSAKNTIAVGAVNSDDLIRTGFSSMGPTFDGRLKPDVVAPGCHSTTGIYSTWPGDAYDFACGTSMSTPAVSGCLALMYEKYQQVYEVDLDVDPPLPSTMKAILCQTATDLVHLTPGVGEPDNPDTGAPVFYHEGPDHATGYGLVNVEAAVELIEQKRLHEFEVAAGTPLTLFVIVPAGLPELKVTIAWDDLAGNPAEDNTVPKLVNDLDLTVEAPDTTVHYPWVVPPLPHEPYDGSLTGIDPITPADVLPATQGVDSLNNVEQVQIQSPDAGPHLITISPTSVTDIQKFSLVANLPLPLVTFMTSCDPVVDGVGRLEMIADLANLSSTTLPVGAAFSVVDCDGTETTFRTISGKRLRRNASVRRTVRVRVPQGLPSGCDLQLRTTLVHEETGEILAAPTCTFRIPQ